MEFVVGEDDYRNRRISEIIRQLEPKSVVVNKNGVQRLIEKLLRHSSFKFIESQIQEFQARQFQNHRRKLTSEPIVAQIQLKQQLQFLELVRNSSTKSIRIDVEQCQIRQQPELLRQIPGDVAMVEIDAGNSPNLRVIKRRSTENTCVVAHIRSSPIRGEIERVGENRLLPSLKRYVRISNTLILELEIRIDGDVLASVAEFILVVEELPVLDVQRFLVSERALAAEGVVILSGTDAGKYGNEEE